MTPPRVDVNPRVKLQVLRLLVDDGTPKAAAETLGIPYQQVIDVASIHGYPEQRSMLKAIEILQDIVDGQHQPTPTPTPPPRKAEKKEDPVPETPKQDDNQLDLSTLMLIVDEGRRSSSKRTVSLANRVAVNAKSLLERVVAERTEKANADRIAELQAEIERLRGNTPKITCRVVNCGQPVANLQGLNLHRTRAHDLPNVKSVDEQEVAS